MVKFGERYPKLQHVGWSQYYVDYEALKKLIEASGDMLSERADASFESLLSAEITKMDGFVARETKSLVAAFEAAKQGPGPKEAVAKMAKDLAMLRHFVGTNVIAITKIVKKHDKHAKEALRGKVSQLIAGAAGMASLPPLQRDVDKYNFKPASPQSVAIEIDFNEEGGDDNESEAQLRSLPNWLLTGALKDESQAGTKSRAEAFYNSYLKEWGVDLRPKDESLPPSKAPSEAGDGVENWRVDFSDDAVPFWQRPLLEQAKVVFMVLLKLAFITFSLYAFICSLSFLADAFRLLAGRQAGQIFRNSEIFNNPIAGMLVGVLVTVLVQSSSTSTSIVITMVAAGLLTVKQAISLIMGANIGTSVTSTIVALSMGANRDEFRRAFAAATVHDMFNFLSVLVLLPIEAATGYLYHFSGALIDASPIGKANYTAEDPPDYLKELTKPFLEQIIGIDKGVIKKIAVAETQEELDALEDKPILKFLFDETPETMSDTAAGVIVLISALAILCTTLFAIVWTLKSLLRGRVAVWLHKSVNNDVPDLKLGSVTVPLGWVAGYLAIGMGLVITILVQSSSITTSALTPLVGVGVINIDRMYPTVLGANIGTCVTGMLAALAADAEKLEYTLQVAFAHLLFNISGIVLFYVNPFFRWMPIAAAKFLGDTTAKYRWFAAMYLLVCFFLLPAIFMGISLGSFAACIIIAVLCVLAMIFVFTVNWMQRTRPEKLPEKLRTWDWLPVWLRSLEPADRIIFSKCTCCKRCEKKEKVVMKKGGETTTSKSELEIAASRIESSAA